MYKHMNPRRREIQIGMDSNTLKSHLNVSKIGHLHNLSSETIVHLRVQIAPSVQYHNALSRRVLHMDKDVSTGKPSCLTGAMHIHCTDMTY